MPGATRRDLGIDDNRLEKSRLTLRRRNALLAAALACGSAQMARGQISGSWAVDAAGNWSNAGNWSSNPNYPDAGGTARFGAALTSAGRTITLDVPVTLSALDYTGATRIYTLSGTNTLTFTGAATITPSGNSLWPPINVPVVIAPGSTLADNVNGNVNGSLAFNGGITGTYIMNAVGTNQRTDMFSTITGAVILNNGTFNLNDPASNPGTGDGRIAGTAGIFLNNGSLQVVNSNKTLSDRIGDNDPITFSAGTLQFNGPVTNGGTIGVNEVLGAVTLSGGFSGFGSVSPAADRLTRVTIASLTRTNNAVQLVRGTALGQNGTYASPTGISSFLKISDPTNEQALVAAEVGDPATTYSAAATNLPIVPWIVADSNQNQGSFNSFASYIVDAGGNGPGFVTLQTSNFIGTAGDGTITTNNVRLTNAAGSPLTLNSSTQLNSLLITSDGGISGTGVLTIASGLIGASGSTGATIANDVHFGTNNTREAVVVVSSGSLTFSGAISTSGGLTKAGGGNLVLSGANSYSGTTSIYGTGGNGTLTIATDSNLGTAPSVPTANSIVINGSVLSISSPTTINANRGLTMTGNATISTDSTVTYNGTITDNNGAKTLTKLGAGRLILGGTGSNFGSFSIITGTVNLAANNTLGSNVNLLLGSASTTTTRVLDLANGAAPTAAFNQTVSSLSTLIPVPGTAADTTPQNDIITNSFSGSTPTFTVNNATANTWPGVISGNLNLAKSSTGTLTLTGTTTYTGLTTVNAGALVLANGAQAPVLTGGGADIRGGRVVFDYSNGGTDPLATVRPILATGYSNNFATGQIKSSTATTNKGLGFSDDTANSRLSVAYTYFGDANLDGVVSTSDFAAMALHFGASTQKWTDGDFNYDGVVNALDFNAIATNFGSPVLTAPPALGTLVPEPASLMLLGLSASFLGRRRRPKTCC